MQHLAFLTNNILESGHRLRASGLDFLKAPAAYYERLKARLGEPLHARPTFFVELMQRRGARGFGSRNIRALFEAVEYEQGRRGSR